LRVLTAAGLVAMAGTVAGCGGASGGSGTTIAVGGLDTLRFTPETIQVKAGEAVTIVFRNEGALPHDFVTQGATRNARMVNVGGKQQQQATFLAAEPGTYTVVCSQFGHTEGGMVAKIVVS
jgi:plastocyanin